MSREVCGICWCPYDEDTGECACPPPNVQKSTLREAATKALEALEALQGGCTDSDDGTVEAITVWCPEVIDDLKAALAEPATLDEAMAGPRALAQAYENGWNAAKAEQGEPVAWYHVPHPGNGSSPMVSLSPQREPSMYAASVPLYLKEQL